MASVIPSPIDERLRGWLEANGIAYQIHEHPLAYTALATAHAEGVEMPVCEAVLAVIEGRMSPSEAVASLLAREPKAE